MDGSGEKVDKKVSKRELKASSKSSTLPPGAMLMAHPGEGFFTKIRRCLRLRTKGKYDFSQTQRPADEDGSSVPSNNGRSPGSPVTADDGDNCKPMAKSSPIKAARKSKSDKEEVMLIRRDKRCSSGFGVATKSISGRDDILVVTVEDDGDMETNEGNPKDPEIKESDEVFEELDPDYETLDDIRRKVQSQVVNGTDVSTAENTVAADCQKSSAGQPVPVKIKTSSDLNGQDSGLGSPFTDSPGSSRESQAHSVTSSVFSSSVVSSNNVEPCKDPGQSVPVTVCIDGAFSPTEDGDPMLTSSLSQCSNSTLEEDDLYSNAKVLIRKKSQRQSQSQTSLSTLDQQSNGTHFDKPRSARNSLSPADFLAMIEAQNPEPLAPPPLPARNYSEEDISARVEKVPTPRKSFGSDLKIHKSGNPESQECRDILFNGAGARPKTFTCSTLRAADEHNPLTSLSSDLDTHFSNGDISHGYVSPSSPEDIPASLAATESIYEDIPDIRVKASQPEEIKPADDDLTHIEDDLAIDCEHQSERADSTELPEDIMIVSASDSCCGNDTDDSLGNNLCSPAEETDIKIPVGPNDPELGCWSLQEEPAPEAAAAAADGDSHQDDCDPRPTETLPDSPETEPCSKSDSKDNSVSSVSQDMTSSLSHPFSTSSSSVSSPSHASSSDTLNNLMDEADADDPDDFEGKDESPPVGPPIHISHQQLLRHLNARAAGDEDSSAEAELRPEGGSLGVRNVRSMEIPRCSHAEQEEEEGAGAASSIRRHSKKEDIPVKVRLCRSMSDAGSSARMRAKSAGRQGKKSGASCQGSVPTAGSHRDFLESMKQLKDCGWYWGPLSYEEAESKLIDKRDGSFLVRDSSNENYILSLSFKSMGQVHHTRIEHHKGLFSFWSQPDSHGKAQICQFIEQTVENSKNGRFLYFLRPAGPGSPPLPIQLLYPISRFFRVPSLQHMCRFLVLRRVRRDHIDFLPVPQKVKGYLLEKQYYVETLDED